MPAAADQFAFWRKALADPAQIGVSLPIVEDDPQPGYYRARVKKGGEFLPLVFWYSKTDGTLQCIFGQDRVDNLNRMNQLWTYGCRHPISTATYTAWKSDGGWPDLDSVVQAQLADPKHNLADTPPEVILADQIEAAMAQLDQYLDIDSDDAAARAQSLRARLLELSGEGSKAHKIEKAPHLEAGRVVDNKWLPLCKKADDGVQKLRRAMSAYETRKIAAENERRREEQRKEEELAFEHFMPPPPEPEIVERDRIKSAYGRAASVKLVKVVIEITDWEALFRFYKGSERVQAELVKLANASLKQDVIPPGIRWEERADVL